MSLNEVWFGLFVLIIAGYLILDGFDFGVGIVHFLVARTDDERRLSSSTASGRSGTATRSGSSWAAASCSRPFPSSTPRCSRASTLRSCSCLLVMILRTSRNRVPQQAAVGELAAHLGHRVLTIVAWAGAAAWVLRSATSLAGVDLNEQGDIHE